MIPAPSLVVSILLAASAMAAAVPALNTDPGPRCATKEPTAKQLAFARELAREGVLAPRSGINSSGLNVDVYLHVVAVSETDGNLSVRSEPGR